MPAGRCYQPDADLMRGIVAEQWGRSRKYRLWHEMNYMPFPCVSANAICGEVRLAPKQGSILNGTTRAGEGGRPRGTLWRAWNVPHGTGETAVFHE